MGNTDKGSDSSSPQGPAPDLKTGSNWSHLISEYLGDLPRQLNSIRTILEIPDYAKIKKQAHRIKGTSGTYGLEAISQDAAQLEQSADTHDSGRIVTAINNMTRSVEIETIRLNPQITSPTASPPPASPAPASSAPASNSREGGANG